MKKNILFFLLYTIMCFTSYSQNKQISYSSVNGLVTYDNGQVRKPILVQNYILYHVNISNKILN